ncbi:MAG: hypothetical protein IKU94_11565, partial [Bacteroidaceae bacterium]|nr:hypothetical protein [Bacteroidaceae bacterium]
TAPRPTRTRRPPQAAATTRMQGMIECPALLSCRDIPANHSCWQGYGAVGSNPGGSCFCA